jgi:hypothetical protein
VGTSPGGVTVYVDPSLGDPGLQNANDLLEAADDIVAKNNDYFGLHGRPANSVNAIIFALGGQTDGTGGADHAACDFVTGGNIEVDASFGSPARIAGLFEAELSECCMNGTLCGLSTGEALSRWLAAVMSNNALSDFATAPQWATDGMPNYVDQTEATDQDPDSTGCGMAFISWLLSTGYTLAQIAPAMVALGDTGTLAQLYSKLSGDDPANAWPNFSAAIAEVAVTSDDPFGSVFPA